MEGVLVMKNVSAKSYSFFNGGSIGDEERLCQTLQFLQWRQYWWSRTCLSNSSASSMEGVLVMKNVSVKLFSFFGGGSIGDQERVCQSLQGGSIGDEERVCQTLQLLQWRQYWWLSVNLQLHQWREYWWWRTCLSNSSVSSVEVLLVIKNVSVKISASLMEGVLVMKNVPVKLFSFFIGGSVGEQERVCQTLQLHKWREYWWSRTCLSNSSASSMEGVLMIKNVSLKLVSFINWGGIGDEASACQTLLLI